MLRRSHWTALAIVASLGACSSESPNLADEDDSEDEDSAEASDRAERRDAGGKRESGAANAGRDAGTSAPRVDDEPKNVVVDAGRAGGAIPCEVAKIVEEKCGLCHGEELGSGVPFPLVTLADFQATVPAEEERVYEAAYRRVSKSGSGMMPPASVDPLSAADKQTLSDWLKEGARDGTACANAGATGKDAGTAVAVAGSGGAHVEPVKYDDPQMKCYEFRAFDPGGRDQPYSVPTTPDFYVNFNFTPPWKGTQYVRPPY